MKDTEIARSDGQGALLTEFRRLSPKITGALLRMRQEAYRDATVPAKYKLLTAMAIAIAIRCEPCVRGYVHLAREAGITQDELIEFLQVAMMMQGCPGEEWALKAYEAFKKPLADGTTTQGTPCCDH